MIYFCKYLGVYPKLLALSMKGIHFHDILILLKAWNATSFVFECRDVNSLFQKFCSNKEVKHYGWSYTFQ